MIYGFNNNSANSNNPEDSLNISFKSAKLNGGGASSGPVLNNVDSAYQHQSPPQPRGEKL
jgi:hypothetical protein